MSYASESITYARQDASYWSDFVSKTSFDDKEVEKWSDICEKMYEPKKEGSKVYLQQDGFLDKEDRVADDLDKSERPINQHWSWDRILRSVFIKQADVLQGMYFFEDDFDEATIRENFLYYEPRTVHESSLSPCVHVVLASKLGMEEKAYEMYLRTARLDLDDYNHEADEGLHITSMAGTWMAVVEGFGGKRVKDGILSLDPMIPKNWNAYRFNLVYRKTVLSITVKPEEVSVKNVSGGSLDILVYGKTVSVPENETISIGR
jgi:maltose phosphorylase